LAKETPHHCCDLAKPFLEKGVGSLAIDQNFAREVSKGLALRQDVLS
jgi:hypothetical protein